MQLSKQDIKALSKCNVFSFRGIRFWNPDTSSICITSSIEGSETSESKDRYKVELVGYVDAYRDGDDKAEYKQTYKMSAYVLDSAGPMKALLAFLKEGDDVTVRWIRNNNNGYLRMHNLVHDEVHMQVARLNRKKDSFLYYTFKISDSISPANSSRLVHTEQETLYSVWDKGCSGYAEPKLGE
jgi:hypothetical protein